ncbi:hypothetical protein VTK26DRAFT_3271 [Humicola hyalothermophila]
MAKRVDPIYLFGFCFATQDKQVFNNSWACAFHTSWYTDESHPMWDTVDDPGLRREIRYGNNIAVLFRALFHCRRFYGQDSLWAAVAKGFNTSGAIVKSTAEILTEARRAQRGKPAKDVSETARAADAWIDFLDSLPSHPRILSDPEVYKVAEAFFKTQDKAFVNEARVPIKRDSRISSINTGRFPPRPAEEEADLGRLSPVSVSLTFEDRVSSNPSMRATRKRSPSPSPHDHTPKSRRLAHDTQMPPKSEKTHERQAETHQRQPTSPLRSNQFNAARPETQASASTKPANGPASSVRPAFEDNSASLRARIANLEAQLAVAESKLKSPVATALPTQIGDVVGGLKKDIATVTNVISTMMDSMHAIVDNLNLLQDDISGLSQQQRQLTAALPPQADKAETLLQPIQSIAESVKSLTQEVLAIKAQTAAQQQVLERVLQQPQQANPNLERILQEQTSRIDQLAREMASMQTQMMTSQPRQQPQTLRQAMDAAERDLSHHLATIQRFYHQLDGTRGVNRVVTERTADCLALMQHTAQAARMWQQGC